MFNVLDTNITRIAAPIRQQVVDRIRAGIVQGKYQPGDRLVEGDLCTTFNVSRTVVREAIRQLEAERLVDEAPPRGVRVAIVTVDEAREIYEVREQLEALAGKGFAIHADDRARQELQAVVKDLIQAANAKDEHSFLELKQRYYATLLGNCGNQVVHDILRRLGNRIGLLRVTSLSQAGRIEGTISEIQSVLDAVVSRDPEAAYEACRYHVEQASINALRILRQRVDS